ncbi:DegT/DnrJ/EryC1/StrS family aminotransferase [candidate division KSB1 bacterium]|nr:DegT/DnrJ/EryC1/StrS family aminotransferase [candidate division KSB1 bacterium]
MSEYSIPLFDLNFDEEEEKAVVKTLRSRWISMGPRCEELEQMFAAMLSIRHAISTANCTTALHLAMRILQIEPGDEIIVPSLTFVATVNAVRYVGAVPVFCDIKGADDLNMDAALIQQLITPRTRAIMVMHYGGFPCRMDKIMAIAKKHDLKVVEDACHGPMSEFEGIKLGGFGDFGCFSFFANKNISTGEGGMIVTKNDDYAARARLLRSHGMTSLSYERARGHSTGYDVVDLGYNYRMDDIRAAIGMVQLQKLLPDLQRRVRLRDLYVEQLTSCDRLVVPFQAQRGFVSNYIFPVVLREGGADYREAVRKKMHAAGIQTSVHYPAVHRFSIYQSFRRKLPHTEFAADHEITLPLYANLSVDSVLQVCRTLREIVEEG